MAKQSGIHQLKGKVRDMSYYRQKGVVDGLARSINQGLSKRVKEDAAYQNTRLNAAEFGTAGSFAGAAIRAISDRQRAMLKDFATGQLAKVVRDLAMSDSENPWGSRYASPSGSAEVLRDVINTYAKNDFASLVGGVWDVEVGEGVGGFSATPDAELPSGWGSAFAAKGATGAFVRMYGYKVTMNISDNAPYRSISQVEVIADEDFPIGTASTITTPATLTSTLTDDPKNNEFTSVLVLVLPYKEVGGQKYIMQELCTFSLQPYTTA